MTKRKKKRKVERVAPAVLPVEDQVEDQEAAAEEQEKEEPVPQAVEEVASAQQMNVDASTGITKKRKGGGDLTPPQRHRFKLRRQIFEVPQLGIDALKWAKYFEADMECAKTPRQKNEVLDALRRMCPAAESTREEIEEYMSQKPATPPFKGTKLVKSSRLLVADEVEVINTAFQALNAAVVAGAEKLGAVGTILSVRNEVCDLITLNIMQTKAILAHVSEKKKKDLEGCFSFCPADRLSATHYYDEPEDDGQESEVDVDSIWTQPTRLTVAESATAEGTEIQGRILLKPVRIVEKQTKKEPDQEDSFRCDEGGGEGEGVPLWCGRAILSRFLCSKATIVEKGEWKGKAPTHNIYGTSCDITGVPEGTAQWKVAFLTPPQAFNETKKEKYEFSISRLNLVPDHPCPDSDESSSSSTSSSSSSSDSAAAAETTATEAIAIATVTRAATKRARRPARRPATVARPMACPSCWNPVKPFELAHPLPNETDCNLKLVKAIVSASAPMATYGLRLLKCNDQICAEIRKDELRMKPWYELCPGEGEDILFFWGSWLPVRVQDGYSDRPVAGDQTPAREQLLNDMLRVRSVLWELRGSAAVSAGVIALKAVYKDRTDVIDELEKLKLKL
jgi:hypothetical protein